eukprot:gene17984-21918_t
MFSYSLVNVFVAGLFACAAFGTKHVEALAPIGCYTDSTGNSFLKVLAGYSQCKAVAAILSIDGMKCDHDGWLYIDTDTQCLPATGTLNSFDGIAGVECDDNESLMIRPDSGGEAQCKAVAAQMNEVLAVRANKCTWVENNYNSDNEVKAKTATSREECVANVRAQCPSATIANYEVGGGESDTRPKGCFCQFGTNMALDSTSEWENCLLSSLDAKCNNAGVVDAFGQCTCTTNDPAVGGIGPSCEYTNAKTCSDDGVAQADGSCVCNSPATTGPSCEQIVSCGWVWNNNNTDNEVEVNPAASRAECIANVRAQCPSATIANYQVGGSECYCQFGTNMDRDPTSKWENCLLSSLEAICNRVGTYQTDKTCKCTDPNAAGPTCEFSNSKTCNNAGVVDAFGQCTCTTNDPAVGGIGPSCKYTNAETCSDAGVAQPDGSCKCDQQPAGPACERIVVEGSVGCFDGADPTSDGWILQGGRGPEECAATVAELNRIKGISGVQCNNVGALSFGIRENLNRQRRKLKFSFLMDDDDGNSNGGIPGKSGTFSDDMVLCSRVAAVLNTFTGIAEVDCYELSLDAGAGLYSSADSYRGSSECIGIAATMNKVLAASAVCAEAGNTAESGEHIHPDGTCACKKGYGSELNSLACAACPANTFQNEDGGTSCTTELCSGAGTVVATSGICECITDDPAAGGIGRTCAFTNADTCSDKGVVQPSGICECTNPADGEGPSCTEFTNAVTCSDKGVAQPDGSCVCNDPADGEGPTCTEFTNAVTCSDMGVAQPDGTCDCNPDVLGKSCNSENPALKASDAKKIEAYLGSAIPISVVTFAGSARYVYVNIEGSKQRKGKLFWFALFVTLRIFDMMSDWAMFGLTLQSEHYTKFSAHGAIEEGGNGKFEILQTTALVFSAIGTVLLMADLCTLPRRAKDEVAKTRNPLEETICGIAENKVLGCLVAAVCVFEDFPQLAIAIAYMDVTEFSGEEPVALFSFFLSIGSLIATAYMAYDKYNQKSDSTKKKICGECRRLIADNCCARDDCCCDDHIDQFCDKFCCVEVEVESSSTLVNQPIQVDVNEVQPSRTVSNPTYSMDTNDKSEAHKTVSVSCPLGISFAMNDRGENVITNVKPGGNAEATGQLSAGMQIVTVNRKPVRGLSKKDVASLIKSSPGSCLLGVSNNDVNQSTSQARAGRTPPAPAAATLAAAIADIVITLEPTPMPESEPKSALHVWLDTLKPGFGDQYAAILEGLGIENPEEMDDPDVIDEDFFDELDDEGVDEDAIQAIKLAVGYESEESDIDM